MRNKNKFKHKFFTGIWDEAIVFISFCSDNLFLVNLFNSIIYMLFLTMSWTFLMILSITQSTIFQLEQTLNTDYQVIRFITTTDENTGMVHSSKKATVVFYDQNGTEFAEDYTYTSDEGNNGRYCGEFTNDKEWFITTYYEQSVAVLKRNSTTGVYEEYQILTVSGS